MQKKIIMTHIMMCALCAVATNVSYAEIETRPIMMVCDSDLKSGSVDQFGNRIPSEKKYKVIAADKEGKTLTLTTKEIQVKHVTKELDDCSSAQTIVARCTKDRKINEHMQPGYDDKLNPTLTCPKGSGIEVWFTLARLPVGYKYSDFTYHAELKIESDDEDNVNVERVEEQKIADNQQQVQNIKNNIRSILPSSQPTSGNGLYW